MIASEPAGHRSVSPYLSGYGCGCNLSGTIDTNPSGYTEVGSGSPFLVITSPDEALYPRSSPKAGDTEDRVNNGEIYRRIKRLIPSSFKDLAAFVEVKNHKEGELQYVWSLIALPDKPDKPIGWIVSFGVVRIGDKLLEVPNTYATKTLEEAKGVTKQIIEVNRKEGAATYAALVDKKPKGLVSKALPFKYVRFCTAVGTPLPSPSFEDDTSVYPLFSNNAERIGDNKIYEVVGAAAYTASTVPLGKGLADKGKDALWLLVKKPEAKEPLGWVLGVVRMRMDNWPKRTEAIPEVGYQGLDAILCSLADKKSEVASKSKLESLCLIAERKLEVMDAYAKGKPDPLEKPQDKPKDDPKDETPPPDEDKPKGGMGLLGLAIGGAALYYLLSKRGRT